MQIWSITIGSFLLLLLGSGVRHELFQSGAWDLGIFDQGVYLISQGIVPFSSLLGFHLLGDHGAWILYLLALFYKIYPSVYWLLGVQALSLSLGALGVIFLGQQAGLSSPRSVVVGLVFLLYPLVLNINLFDFHPEVIAVPLFILAIWAARAEKLGIFVTAILLITGCKAVLSLTIVSMGLWLWGIEKKKIYGLLAMVIGAGWFVIATQWLMPTFGGTTAVSRFLDRYSQLGDSWSRIAINGVIEPWRWLGKVFSVGTLEYLGLLLGPIIYIFPCRNLGVVISMLPSLGLNILADNSTQRDLIHQYSVPIMPFLFLIIIESLKSETHWWKSTRSVLGWSIFGFLLLSRVHFFGSNYLANLDQNSPIPTAISLIQDQASVLTTNEIAPHLTHRSVIKLALNNQPIPDLNNYHHILLNLQNPGWLSSREFQQQIIDQLAKNDRFERKFSKNEVFLYSQKISFRS